MKWVKCFIQLASIESDNSGGSREGCLGRLESSTN